MKWGQGRELDRCLPRLGVGKIPNRKTLRTSGRLRSKSLVLGRGVERGRAIDRDDRAPANQKRFGGGRGRGWPRRLRGATNFPRAVGPGAHLHTAPGARTVPVRSGHERSERLGISDALPRAELLRAGTTALRGGVGFAPAHRQHRDAPAHLVHRDMPLSPFVASVSFAARRRWDGFAGREKTRICS